MGGLVLISFKDWAMSEIERLRMRMRMRAVLRSNDPFVLASALRYEVKGELPEELQRE